MKVFCRFSMNSSHVRVRFAPAPTGSMHIGNIRTALMNVLFARQKNGSAILRIEDTDRERDFDPQAIHIQADLAWLGLTFTEGPATGGPHAPYFQSQRTGLYQNYLEKLEKLGFIYRCFCSPEELEKKRDRQIALKLPPRYDRTCHRRTIEEIKTLLEQKAPFIWRVALPHHEITIHDLARGNIVFNLKNFSDFPITRQDGSFTFIFANFVDDLTMNITHVFRGEDHLSNTACQTALYHMFSAQVPVFWHMPMICNTEGKKLSKRDFAFSVKDLQKEGFLPEAVVNYLGILGSSYTQEIMSFTELAHAINFNAPASAGFIKYDVEKLRWINKQWISRYNVSELAAYCLPFIHEKYPESTAFSKDHFVQVLDILRSDYETISQLVDGISFYLKAPVISSVDIAAATDERSRPALYTLFTEAISQTNMVEFLKNNAQKHDVPIKDVYRFARLALMGATHGPSIVDLIKILGIEESNLRLINALQLLRGIF